VKAKILLLFASFVCGNAAIAYGQVNCTTSNKLVCEFPASIVGITAGVVSSSDTALFNAVSKEAQKQTSPFNSSIATQLTQLPIPSGAIGTVVIQQAGNPFGVPFDNLGPVLTDRPDTVGRRVLVAGFSYQHFNFNAIDGIDFKSLPFAFCFSETAESCATSNSNLIYAGSNSKVSFHLNQYIGLLTYGLTKTTDVSVIVPFNDISLDVTNFGYQTFVYAASANEYVNESPAAGTITKTSGSASGFGDVIVTVKQLLLGQEGRRPAVAVGADVRFPTGDSLNYLGSGAYGVNLHGLFEYRWKVSPHFKMGYQWNGNSQIVNLGTSGSRLPGGLQYDAGADYRIHRKLTVAADVLGSQFVNSPFATNNNGTVLPLSPAPSTTVNGAGVPSSLASIASSSNTYTTADFSVGLKWRPEKHWILYGNVLFPINNTGLRSDPAPLFGVSFSK
jgi:hypothetical protein